MWKITKNSVFIKNFCIFEKKSVFFSDFFFGNFPKFQVDHMLGDVNLFISTSPSTENPSDDVITGEVEVMIAEPRGRGKGIGEEAVRVIIAWAYEVKYFFSSKKKFLLDVKVEKKILKKNSETIFFFRIFFVKFLLTNFFYKNSSSPHSQLQNDPPSRTGSA